MVSKKTGRVSITMQVILFFLNVNKSIRDLRVTKPFIISDKRQFIDNIVLRKKYLSSLNQKY